MRNCLKTLAFSVAVIGVMTTAARSQAAGVLVTYSVTGTSGNYDLDFSVTNNMLANPTMGVYFFGVELSAPNIIASPLLYNPNVWATWSNAGYGGSSTVYNNNWIEFSFVALLPGTTLSGFKVNVTDLAAPTSVKWFAYGYGGSPYLGGDNFWTTSNPGFEGVAGDSVAVPEPTSLLVFGFCCVGFVVRSHRRRKSSAEMTA